MLQLDEIVSYQEVKSIKDERFNIEYLSQYELLIVLYHQNIHIAVVDTVDHRCLFIEEVELDTNNLIKSLSEYFENHHFLKAGYWKKIKFSQYNNKFTLIPNALFIEENSFDYLDLVSDLKLGLDKVLVHHHEKSGITSVFSVDYDIYRWISDFYVNKRVVFIHPTSAQIEMLLLSKNNDNKEVLELNFSNEHFCIGYKKGAKLEFANIFTYKCTEDVMYYTIAVLESLNADLSQLSCNVYGNIEQNGDSVLALKDFIKNVRIGTKQKNMQFSYQFDEIQFAKYNDVLAAYLC